MELHVECLCSGGSVIWGNGRVPACCGLGLVGRDTPRGWFVHCLIFEAQRKVSWSLNISLAHHTTDFL